MTIETSYHEDSDGSLIVHRKSDVEANLNANKSLYTLNDGYTSSRDLRRAASIPMSIVEKWRTELGVDLFNPDHLPAVRRLLNSNEYLYLRTAPGRL
jgi:hypothetical protein